MPLPELVYYSTSQRYREHYKSVYCRNKIYILNNIRVHFESDKFNHAFYESPSKDGVKSSDISANRAQRIDWIKYVLENDKADLFQGWNKHKKKHEADRRVSLLVDSYVVVVEFTLKPDETLRAKFITAYVVDGDYSLNKIKSSPAWDIKDCIRAIKEKKRT